MSLRKTFKNLFRKSVGGKKKKHKKKKRVSRKGRGYVNECIIPAPYNEIKKEDSCSIIDLHDDYGDVELPEELRDKKECNMYYYIKDGKYYRCRNGRGKKCSKTGKFGSGKTKCNSESVARIEEGNMSLEAELQDLVNPMPSVVVLPSVPKSFPSVPNTPFNPNLVNRNVTSTRSQLPRSSMPRSSMPRSSMSVSNMPQSSRTTRKQSVKMLPTKNKKELETTIDRLVKQNQQYTAKKQELINKLKSRGNVTKQIERQMKIAIARENKMYEAQIKRNEDMINNLTRMLQI